METRQEVGLVKMALIRSVDALVDLFSRHCVVCLSLVLTFTASQRVVPVDSFSFSLLTNAHIHQPTRFDQTLYDDKQRKAFSLLDL